MTRALDGLEALPRDATIWASVSGGKDSTALSLALTEAGIEHRRLFADTGWEHPATYEYLDALERRIGPIERVRGARLMVDLIRAKTMFPTRVKRYCTQHLKIRPLRAHMLAHSEGEVVNAIGLRGQESRARARLSTWEVDPECGDVLVWRPLLSWMFEDVVEIHRRHDVLPNPLYMEGHERVGCWPCIFARKDEIGRLPQSRVDEIAALERELTEAARARGSENPLRSFFGFHDPLTGQTRCTPIEEVRAWSRTSRGGVQLRLIDEAPAGCARWGLCEHLDREGSE